MEGEGEGSFDFSSWKWCPQKEPLRSLSSKVVEVQECQGEERGGIGTSLKSKLCDLMDNFPNGVSVAKFVSNFHFVNHYFPNYRMLGFSSMDCMLRSANDVFSFQNSPLGESLLFPSSFNGLNASEIFHKTWMDIQLLLPKNQYLLMVEDVPRKLLESHNVRIDPSDWHLGDEMAFYDYCLKTWPAEEPILLENDIQDPCKKVLVVRNPQFPLTLQFEERREELERIDGLKRAQVAKRLYERGITCRDYVRFGDHIQYLSDDIQEGKYYKCLAGAIYSPGNFYVNVTCSWNQLEKLMEDMQKVYKILERSELEILPISETLVVGLYVAAKRNADGQWHRALITKRLEDQLFQVLNIDYGDIEIVSIESIRYLTNELFKRMKAQAVRCLAKIGWLYNVGKDVFNRGEGWTESQGHIFRNLVNDENLAIKFIASVDINGSRTWQVFVHVLSGTSHTVHSGGLHIERQVMKTSKSFYFIHDDDETDECGELNIVSTV